MGKFVEGLTEPAVYKVFPKVGIKIIGTYPRALRHYNGETMEVDVLAVGKMNKDEDVIIFVEVKTEPISEDINEIIKDIKNFPKFFNEYKRRKIIGVISGIKMSKSVAKYAEKSGLYVLSPSGDTMKILNRPNFKPKIWK